MKTILILTIEHSKPLPEKMVITDVVSERAYNWLRAQDCPASVTATQCTQVPAKPEKWEIVK